MKNSRMTLLLIVCFFIAIVFFVLHFRLSTKRISGKEWIVIYQDNNTQHKLELEYIGKDILLSSIDIRIECGLYRETLHEDYDTNTFLINGRKIEFDLSDVKQIDKKIKITIKYNNIIEKIII